MTPTNKTRADLLAEVERLTAEINAEAQAAHAALQECDGNRIALGHAHQHALARNVILLAALQDIARGNVYWGVEELRQIATAALAKASGSGTTTGGQATP